MSRQNRIIGGNQRQARVAWNGRAGDFDPADPGLLGDHGKTFEKTRPGLRESELRHFVTDQNRIERSRFRKNVAIMMSQRGIVVTHTTILRRVQRYLPTEMFIQNGYIPAFLCTAGPTSRYAFESKHQRQLQDASWTLQCVF